MKKNKVLHYARRVISWLVPVVILAIVFFRIDIGQLRSSIAHTNVIAFGLGLALAPMFILLGGMRWSAIVQSYSTSRLSKSFFLKTYWVGMALGMFVPASLGWDIYRIAAVSKRIGKPIANIFAIFVEKALALVTMAVLVVTLYPFAQRYLAVQSPYVARIVRFSYISIVAFVLLGAAAYFTFRNRAASSLVKNVERVFSRFLSSAVKRVRLNLNPDDMQFSIRGLFSPLSRPSNYGKIVLFSFAIQLASAVRAQIYLISLGYSLPFIVNLFLVPIFFLIFILPISFGSLGIREGTFILLYGLFGVPAEIALLASFYSLLGILLNIAIGGVIMLLDRPQVRRIRAECEDAPLGKTGGKACGER